jgi:hypothetical protein
MKLATKLAVFTAAAFGAASTIALAQANNPPAPKPAAGALSQATVKAQNRAHRTQTGEEQKTSEKRTAIAPTSSRK